MAGIIEDIQYFPWNVFEENIRTTAKFYLTLRCNMNCPDCYVLHALPVASKYQMPEQDVNFYLDELRGKTNFFPAAVLTGGEPLLLSTDYLQKVTQNALNNKYLVEWKTNGKFAADVTSRKSVFDMVHRLNIPKESFLLNSVAFQVLLKQATEEDKCRYGIYSGNEYMKECGLEMLANKYGINVTASPLALTVSVDSVVHTGESEKWYENILYDIAKDGDLRKKIWLSRVTLGGEPARGCYVYDGYCHNFFEGAPKKDPNGPYFGDDWLYKSNGSVEFCFWPDRTVSLESGINMQPIGRVSYINSDGSYKNLYAIVKDIQKQLLQDYAQKR